MIAADLCSPAAVVARSLHRVECPCGWLGYRRSPWGRDCPACGLDASKLRPVWLAGCAPHRGRCCYLGHIWPPYGHAEHYLGFTTNLPRRWPEHLAGCWRRYPDLPDPPSPPSRRRFVHDPAVWDATAEWNRAFPELAYPDPPAAAALQVGGLS